MSEARNSIECALLDHRDVMEALAREHGWKRGVELGLGHGWLFGRLLALGIDRTALTNTDHGRIDDGYRIATQLLRMRQASTHSKELDPYIALEAHAAGSMPKLQGIQARHVADAPISRLARHDVSMWP